METPIIKYQHSTLSSSHVRVVLRVRPFLPSEIHRDGTKPVPCVSLIDQVGEEVTVHLKDQCTSRNECYKLDSFFGEEVTISQIFNKEVSSVIPGIFHGINATVFAYGATGSGKTYTMQGTEKEPGIIPLAMSAVLAMSRNTRCSVDISFYEVYMDRCYDLLESKAREIKALDDENGRVQLKGLSWVTVSSMDEFAEVFSTGIQRRKVAHTSLNDCSSRSHAVVSIEVRNDGINGKLNLIDLAESSSGNEDNRRTCNEGIRLQESAKINQSLFALSNVIRALNHNEQRIPYRESKLTRILQDSLGRDSRALMIACLSPGPYQEAVHTVSLAARSRQIVNYVGSAKRKETPKEMIDMEAKLKAWLESRGKTKSVQRMNGLCSPTSRIAPTSQSYAKNSKSTMYSEVVSPDGKGRKLFDFGSQVSTCAESASSNSKRKIHVNKDKADTIDLPEKFNERVQEEEVQSKHRKALTPVQPINKSPLSSACEKSKMKTSTQTDKFYEFSSNLKESLIEEYISFLNVAGKEELMQLKVQDLLKRGARGIFT
ncbi:hypothetical protein HPP92_018593 [Vanilla planifolia]|uniref:Kinesin motor domain-containing protein n=1 Tax=Vanilla planifolia TaxID=51239 RepID=A0A835QA33_VANPL|nr:hypothetical protein HPP92_018593 [Vanilla planifolia]